ncbi:SIPA1L2, partial [Cordylochernes scorpioides]
MEVDGGGLSSEILRARSLEYYKGCHQQPGTRLHKSGSTTQLNGYHAPKYTPRRTTYTPTPVNGSRPHRTHSERTNNRNVPVSRPQASSPVVSLYRSNSSLDLDHCEASILRRDFGSASSLDVVSSTSGESFFDLLQGFRTGSIDQRSPGPPNIQEYLRGKIDPLPTTQNASNVLANGSDSLEDAQSPRLKTKFHRLWEIKEKSVKPRSKLLGSEPSLFRKLRGGTGHHRTESTIEKADQVLDTEARLDDKLRRKAFAHYDCQSLTANLSYASRLRSLLSRRRNTTTGASAASMVGRMEGPGDVDYGDNRESDLVLSCPFFRNELGGEEERMISLNRVTSAKPQSAGLHKPTLACGLSLLENANLGRWKHRSCPYQKIAWHIENVDVGALCYRQHFYNQEHQNWLGTDEQLGPVALSIKREKMSMSQGNFQYRLILRTSEPKCCAETSGPAFDEFLELLGQRVRLKGFEKYRGGLDTKSEYFRAVRNCWSRHCAAQLTQQACTPSTPPTMTVRSSSTSPPSSPTAPTTNNRWVTLDSAKITWDGCLYPSSFELLESNIHFMSEHFHGHLLELQICVQLLRKRHIGNDIVTIVFQEPDALPFTPKTIRSHFQHVFVVVRAQNPCSEHTRYRVAISRSKEVPVFGPPIPEGGTFAKSRSFTDFLLTKVINGENAAHRSEKFATMAQRTRQEYLKDLAASYSTTTTVDSNPKFSLLSFGGRKKERCGPSRPKFNPHCSVMGAIAWQVQVEDFGQATVVEAILGVSADTMVVVEETTREVIFACPCNSVLGWTSTPGSLKVFYHQGECILLRPRDSEADEVREMVARLECVTSGCETRELQLRRNSLGQLGFHLGSEGVVTEVEHCGFAWQAGLRSGARLLEICTVAVATLPYEAMVDLLKTSLTVTVAVVPPLTGTQARRGCVLHHCNYLPSGPPTSPGDYENLVDLLH